MLRRKSEVICKVCFVDDPTLRDIPTFISLVRNGFIEASTFKIKCLNIVDLHLNMAALLWDSQWLTTERKRRWIVSTHTIGD